MSGDVSLIVGAISSLFAIVAALGFALSRISSRIARIEEWIRVREQEKR